MQMDLVQGYHSSSSSNSSSSKMGEPLTSLSLEVIRVIAFGAVRVWLRPIKVIFTPLRHGIAKVIHGDCSCLTCVCMCVCVCVSV